MVSIEYGINFVARMPCISQKISTMRHSWGARVLSKWTDLGYSHEVVFCDQGSTRGRPRDQPGLDSTEVRRLFHNMARYINQTGRYSVTPCSPADRYYRYWGPPDAADQTKWAEYFPFLPRFSLVGKSHNGSGWSWREWFKSGAWSVLESSMYVLTCRPYTLRSNRSYTEVLHWTTFPSEGIMFQQLYMGGNGRWLKRDSWCVPQFHAIG